MTTPPPPDPTGRPSSAKHAPGPGGELPTEGTPAGDGKKSTHSHYPASDPLSDVLRNSGSSRRVHAGSDILQILSNPVGLPDEAVALPAIDNTDDSPTVITQRSGAQTPRPPLPDALQVTGDSPSVAGRKLGHYELIEAIGAGGMAAVLKARDTELGRVVALKILPPEAARDSESVARFRAEARAAARLDHENIARVYSCGEDQGLHFIVFEFVEGINLRQMIDRRGTIPAGDCVRYMIQVAAGLSHAAERGVVHRDIKPSNIVITPDGRAKIVDMGLARQLDVVPVNGGVTQSGVTLGTFDYISPEQALDPRRADVRSDIYSLGCAFYHALTGRPPVPEGTAAKKLHAHQHVDPLDPRILNPNIPEELVLVLARMMAKDPARRYQTPAELISHLKGLVERLRLSPDTVGHDSVVRAVPTELAVVPPAPRLRAGWVLGAAAVALAAAAFALSGGTPAQRSTSPPWQNDRHGAKADPLPGLQNGTAPDVVPADDVVVRSAEQFAAKLADPNTTRVLLAAGVQIDLTQLTEPVMFRGKELELVGSPGAPAVLRVNAAALDPAAPPRPGTLSLSGTTDLTVTGVWFDVAALRSSSAASAGLVLPDASRVTLTDCVFAPAAGTGSVRVGREKARVRVERCAFAPSAFGVWVSGGCDLTVTDCGFGPHDAAIQVGDPRAESPVTGVAVRLDRSSFLLAPDAAVVRNADAVGGGEPGVRVTAGHCVFAPTAGPSFFVGASVVRSAVVRSATERGTEFVGEPGRKNAYYGTVPLAVASPDEAVRYLPFEACAAEKLHVSDAGAVQLGQRPWGEPDPLAVLSGRDPWRAFRLKLTDAALFTRLDERDRVIGAQFHNPNVLPPRRAYPDAQTWPPDMPKAAPSSASAPHQLVWAPDAVEPLPKDTFDDLGKLLRSVRTGDEILIRHNGPLPVEGFELKTRPGAGDFRVTFKPHDGFAPVLTAPGGQPLDQSLFRLLSGEVAFERVQFFLKPSQVRSEQVVAAVKILGGKACAFRECVFTLAEEDDAKAAAVHVPDPGSVMAMDKGAVRPTPEITFRQCVVRGRGRGVWVRVGLPVRVEFDQSLTGLDGPLYLAEPGGKPTPGSRSTLRLNRVTSFVGGPVVELRGGAKFGEMRVSGLVPLDVHADECLFAAVTGAGRPLVELDSVDPAEVSKTGSGLLEWQVKTANRYAGFDSGTPVMVVRPGDGTPQKEWPRGQWVTFAGEPGENPFGTATFEDPPAGLKELAGLKPADAVVKAVDFRDLPAAKPTDAGVAEKLPVPSPTSTEP